LKRIFQVLPHGFMVRLGGEPGQVIGCPVLRLGGTWLFPLSSRELVQICLPTFTLFNNYMSVVMHLLILNDYTSDVMHLLILN
jgi:hypothetical protein